MKSYEINDRSILFDDHVSLIGPSVLAYPDFSQVGSVDTKILTITLTCKRV